MKISAAMMMKNEAEMLPQCLDSINAIVDEIVIVDTGSTDDSIKIAKSYGAKVYEHTWEDNFSLHRNQSLSYVTGDWVFIIDCDEKLETKYSKKQLKHVIKNFDKGVNHCLITMKDMAGGKCIMEFNTPRLFKKGAVLFDGIVHNRPVVKAASTIPVLKDIVLEHYGYALSDEKMESKFERTKSLLDQRLADDPTDYEAHFYLGELFGSRDVEAAIKHLEIYLENKDNGSHFNPSVYAALLSMYLYKKDFKKAEALLIIALKELPNDIDVCMRFVEFGQMTNRGDIVLQGAERFVQAYEAYEKNAAEKGNRFTFHNDLSNLSYCYYQLAANYLGRGMYFLDRFENTITQLPEQEKAAQANLMNQTLLKMNINSTVSKAA